jgi:hypothetical protein
VGPRAGLDALGKSPINSKENFQMQQVNKGITIYKNVFEKCVPF